MYYNNYGQPLFPAQQYPTTGPARVTPLITETYMSNPPPNPAPTPAPSGGIQNTVAEYFQKNLWWIVTIIIIIVIGVFVWKYRKPQEDQFINF